MKISKVTDYAALRYSLFENGMTVYNSKLTKSIKLLMNCSYSDRFGLLIPITGSLSVLVFHELFPITVSLLILAFHNYLT